MARYLPEPCEFSSLDSWHKRFLKVHKAINLARHPFVGLVIQVDDAEKFPQGLGLESLTPFLIVSKHRPYLTAVARWRWQRDFYNSNLLAKLMVLPCQVSPDVILCG